MKATWKEETLAAVEAAKAEEALRTPEERKAVPKKNYLSQRSRAILNVNALDGDERKTKELWISKKILGKTPAQNPDAPIVAPRYEAWLVDGELPAWIGKRFADQHWLWNALALPIQHAIREVRAKQNTQLSAIFQEAEANGLNTKDPDVQKKVKAVFEDTDHSPIKNMIKQRELVLQTADQVRSRSIKEEEIQQLNWNLANWNFVASVAALPAWLVRLVDTRIQAASKARRTRGDKGAGDKWWIGYPQPDLADRGEEGGLDVYYNGDNITWTGEPMSNGYVDISAAYDPTDHSGPRGGKYRAFREMRKVTLYEPGSAGARTKKSEKNKISLNVLFHSSPASARMKGYKLRAEKDAAGKLRWYFIPTFELPTPEAPALRTYAGIDPGLRQDGEGGYKAIHVWYAEAQEYKCYSIASGNNRWVRRYNAQQAKLPEGQRYLLELTHEGLRDFASRKDMLLRDLKVKIGEVLTAAGKLPMKWNYYGKTGIDKLMYSKHDAVPELKVLHAEYEAWIKLDRELGKVYSVAHGKMSEHLDTQRYKIAREILLRVTDIGLENFGSKAINEKENEGENWERAITNKVKRNRQYVGPSKFKTILMGLAVKMGKRVHLIEPAYTSKTCSECGQRNTLTKGEKFICEQCGIIWNRDENASRNMARLARECAEGDDHGLKCSRTGTDTAPHHGLATPEERAEIKARKKSKKVRKTEPTEECVAVAAD
jgi:Putative transposase DNA-binding domain